MRQVFKFLLCSMDTEVAQRLGAALGELGTLVQEKPVPELVARRLGELRPQLVFLDFVPDADDPDKLRHTAEVAHRVARVDARLPRVAIGRLAAPESAVAALRAGVSDFADIDTDVAAGESVRRMVQGLLQSSAREAVPERRLRSVLLLGSRIGVGCSTLAVHLAALMQDQLAAEASQPGAWQGGFEPGPRHEAGRSADRPLLRDRVGVLDLGVPAGDCLLYLNTSSEFDFVEAVRNLRRLDDTLLASAVAHAPSGVSALALPQDLELLRGVSHSDSLSLYERLRVYFGALVTDAGGLANFQFLRGLMAAADETWLVTDQSIGALVSLAAVLKELEHKEIDPGRLHLVVNRYDERYGMSAAQISERFKLRLRGVLPDRSLHLRASANQGRLLHQDYRRDPYVRAVKALAAVLRTGAPAGTASLSERLAQSLLRRTRHARAQKNRSTHQS